MPFSAMRFLSSSYSSFKERVGPSPSDDGIFVFPGKLYLSLSQIFCAYKQVVYFKFGPKQMEKRPYQYPLVRTQKLIA